MAEVIVIAAVLIGYDEQGLGCGAFEYCFLTADGKKFHGEEYFDYDHYDTNVSQCNDSCKERWEKYEEWGFWDDHVPAEVADFRQEPAPEHVLEDSVEQRCWLLDKILFPEEVAAAWRKNLEEKRFGSHTHPVSGERWKKGIDGEFYKVTVEIEKPREPVIEQDQRTMIASVLDRGAPGKIRWTWLEGSQAGETEEIAFQWHENPKIGLYFLEQPADIIESITFAPQRSF